MPRKKNVPDPGDANMPAPVGERPYPPHLSAEDILDWQREFRRAHLSDARWHYIKFMLLIAPPRTRDDALAVRLWLEGGTPDFFDIGRLNKTTMLPTPEQLAVWKQTHEALVLAHDRQEYRTPETNYLAQDDALAWAFCKGYDLPPEWRDEVARSKAGEKSARAPGDSWWGFFPGEDDGISTMLTQSPNPRQVPRTLFENYGMATVSRDGRDPRVMHYLSDAEIQTLQLAVPEWKDDAPKLRLLHEWLVGTAKLSPETIDTATMPYLLSVIRAHFNSATEPEIPTERKVGAHRKDPSKPFAGKSCGDLEMRMSTSTFEVRIIGNSGAKRSFAIEDFGLNIGQPKMKLLCEIFIQSDAGETLFEGVSRSTISKLNKRFTEIWGVTDLLIVKAGRKLKTTAGRIVRS
jgi:hypothetical protein